MSSRPRFPILGEACTDQVLQPGQDCTIDVMFSLLPNQDGQSVEANVAVRFTASDNPQGLAQVPLSGQGISAQGDTLFGNGFDWLSCQ